MFIMSLFILSFVTIKHTVPKFSTTHSDLRETFVDPFTLLASEIQSRTKQESCCKSQRVGRRAMEVGCSKPIEKSCTETCADMPGNVISHVLHYT